MHVINAWVTVRVFALPKQLHNFRTLLESVLAS